MAAELVLHIAQSIDGKIATKDHSVAWLPEELTGYNFNGFLSEITHILSGRNTYEFIKNWGGEWPYPGKKFYLFTSDKTYQPIHNEVEVIHENAADFCKKLKEEAEGKIWLLGGGPLIASLLDAELIDEIQIAVISTLLGDGIPLTTPLSNIQSWRLKSLKHFNEAGYMSVYRQV